MSAAGSATAHESAHLHVSGEARYADDIRFRPTRCTAHSAPAAWHTRACAPWTFRP